MKIVTILGARPQFIKAAMLSKAFKANDSVQEVLIHTGQHYDANMSDVFFDEMGIPKPNYNLSIKGRLHGEMTGQMLEKIEQVLQAEQPDVAVVFGDTNSTLAGALAAAKLHIPVAHIEAGLRSFNKKMPEEVNRLITDHISEILFAPTLNAVANLNKEGIFGGKVFNVGDIMHDAFLHYMELTKIKSTIVNDLGINGKPFVLATLHRAENTNDPVRLEMIMDQFKKIAEEKIIVMPLHPRTRSFLKKDFTTNNFRIIPPVGYFDMLALQDQCKIIVTDSGGVQKEAYFNKKYCITVREETEWVELVELGYNFLANPIESLAILVEDIWQRKFEPPKHEPYGDGNTAFKIVSILKSFYQSH
jgi:UDP-GlcNAc3NAcA epimerase